LSNTIYKSPRIIYNPCSLNSLWGTKSYRKFDGSRESNPCNLDKIIIDSSLTSKADIVGLDDLPVKNNSMDYVISFQVLEHLPNPHKVILELYRVLKPNGTILI
jgi:SAM-dependent methyltransferase